MVVPETGSYDQFKALVDGLGGNNRTTVVAQDSAGVFQAFAMFGSDGVAVKFSASAKPAGFDTDFPQTVFFASGGFTSY